MKYFEMEQTLERVGAHGQAIQAFTSLGYSLRDAYRNYSMGDINYIKCVSEDTGIP